MPDEDPPAILEAHDVARHFGGLKAVDGMSVRIAQGSLTGIIGPNGAGKSTFFNVLAGFYPPDAGRVVFQGRDVTHAPAYKRARLGIGRTFQITRPLARLSVLENLLLAPSAQVGERAFGSLIVPTRVANQEDGIRAKAHAMLEFFELDALADAYAGSLSGGQKKLLELARALMAEPSLMLLDEPMAGVNPTLARKLMDKIEALRRDRGITFVLVEHDLETVFARCDPIVVMANGRKLAEGSAEEIQRDASVVDAYLGG